MADWLWLWLWLWACASDWLRLSQALSVMMSVFPQHTATWLSVCVWLCACMSMWTTNHLYPDLRPVLTFHWNLLLLSPLLLLLLSDIAVTGIVKKKPKVIKTQTCAHRVCFSLSLSLSTLAPAASQLDDDINALGTRYTKPIYLLPAWLCLSLSAVMKQSTTATATATTTAAMMTSYKNKNNFICVRGSLCRVATPWRAFILNDFLSMVLKIINNVWLWTNINYINRYLHFCIVE